MFKDKLVYRHISAIAALILISLLSSWSGLPSVHEISNSWDGFLWGMAEPVLRVDRFVSIVAIGLLAAGIVRSNWIAISFVLAATSGTVIHLLQISLPITEIAIAITSISFGVMLFMPNRPKFWTLLILTAIAGLSQGYVSSESLIAANTISSEFYIFGATLTQYAVVISCNKIGNTIEFTDMPKTMSFVGCAICALSIVFWKISLN
jgi:urease accessory protein